MQDCQLQAAPFMDFLVRQAEVEPGKGVWPIGPLRSQMSSEPSPDKVIA